MMINYRNNPDKNTLDEVEKTLKFIRKWSKGLVESEGDSKWTSGNTIFCNEGDGVGMYTFMVGALASGKVTFHIMPLYAIKELQVKYNKDFEPFVSGKSCIQFSKFEELPMDALTDVIKNGAPLFKKVMEEYYAKRKKTKK